MLVQGGSCLEMNFVRIIYQQFCVLWDAALSACAMVVLWGKRSSVLSDLIFKLAYLGVYIDGLLKTTAFNMHLT